MSDEKKSLKQVIPKDELKNQDDYANHLESPLHELKSKEDVVESTKKK